MKSDIRWISKKFPGRLGIMPHPRGDEWLEDEVTAWQADGVNLVVSLLMPDEVSELGLLNEGGHCQEKGIGFVSFPVLDRSVPPLNDRTIRVMRGVHREVQKGENIAVHCRMGIGRSGLMLASILALQGHPPEWSFPLISAARGVQVPDTKEQIEWVDRFYKTVAKL